MCVCSFSPKLSRSPHHGNGLHCPDQITLPSHGPPKIENKKKEKTAFSDPPRRKPLLGPPPRPHISETIRRMHIIRCTRHPPAFHRFHRAALPNDPLRNLPLLQRCHLPRVPRRPTIPILDIPHTRGLLKWRVCVRIYTQATPQTIRIRLRYL